MGGNTYVAIMAGGIGSRFWPMSRMRYPKQFLDILGSGQTLIQATYKRFLPFVPSENIFVITSKDYSKIVQQQLPGIPAENILSEPCRKNTAPCIAYISFKLKISDPTALLIVAPADHLIHDTVTFTSVCLKALDFISENTNAIVTLGMRPAYPNTGYGYIQYKLNQGVSEVYKVNQFVEKPDLVRARQFITEGNYLWNAGIFFFSVGKILQAFEQYLPEMYELFSAYSSSFNSVEEENALAELYCNCDSVSIDKGIMERDGNVYVIPSSFGWSDLGTWNSAYENLDKDESHNAVRGTNAFLINTEKCLINVPGHKLVVVQGLEDYIIVDTEDVIMICKKDKEQEIKEYVGHVKETRGDEFI